LFLILLPQINYLQHKLSQFHRQLISVAGKDLFLLRLFELRYLFLARINPQINYLQHKLSQFHRPLASVAGKDLFLLYLFELRYLFLARMSHLLLQLVDWVSLHLVL